MTAQGMFFGMCALVAAYLLFDYTNRDGIELPRPLKGYYFAPNETQRLIAEAGREAARVAAARAGPQPQLSAGSAAAAATSAALTQYGVALKAGDEALEATIRYVHQFHKLAADAQFRAEKSKPGAASSPSFEKQSPVPVHVFLAADNGSYSGMHELYYIAAAMRYTTPLHIDGCRSASFGFLEKPRRDALTWHVHNEQQPANETTKGAGLRKIPVLAVTTGIYVTSSAACTAAVMELPMFAVQSVTLIGTAGVSPVVGGGGWNPHVPTPPKRSGSYSAGGLSASTGAASAEKAEKQTNPSCQQRWAPESEKVALGSVCVTYAALLQECGHCVEENDVMSLCSRPRCSMHNSTTFFGPCGFKHPSSAFAEQMKGAMYRRPFPEPPSTVKEAMQAFWQGNDAVTPYVPKPGRKKPKQTARSKRRRAQLEQEANEKAATDATTNASDVVLSYNRLPPSTPILLNCAEVATNQIVAGPRADVLCRQYTEELFEGLYPAKELTCVQAMEGVGVLHVLTREYPHIPVAIVRGASNYDMFPLARHVHLLKRTPNANGIVRDDWYVAWEQKEHYVNDETFHRFTKASYHYSIETASAVVLNYFLSADTVLPGML